MQTIMILLLTLFANCTKNHRKVRDRFEDSFPYLGTKMEEDIGDQIYSKDSYESFDEPNSDNFVSFLLDNIKELFVPSDNSTMLNTYGYDPSESALILESFKATTNTENSYIPIDQSNIPPANYSLISDNFHLPFLQVKSDIANYKLNSSIKTDTELLDSLKHFKWKPKKIANDSQSQFKITCISCNNILNEDCSNPKSKLVPTIDCLREDDLCYSQHTPFGIIDRGCFNINHDLMQFVCACNLCNYISISEMPYMFSKKRDWVANVIELSRAKRFRESIFKDMSCLRCEVNVTAKRRHTLADGNCLEGNIPELPKQKCTADEICGIKSIRNQNYIWRGCVNEPLYNYWWKFCDKDSCNDDALVSIYDRIN